MISTFRFTTRSARPTAWRAQASPIKLSPSISKLKEALSAQPAAFDPHELTKAEERIKTLQKENDLLKVSLNQAKQAAAAAVPETKSPAPAPGQTSGRDKETIAALQTENEGFKK